MILKTYTIIDNSRFVITDYIFGVRHMHEAGNNTYGMKPNMFGG